MSSGRNRSADGAYFFAPQKVEKENVTPFFSLYAFVGIIATSTMRSNFFLRDLLIDPGFKVGAFFRKWCILKRKRKTKVETVCFFCRYRGRRRKKIGSGRRFFVLSVVVASRKRITAKRQKSLVPEQKEKADKHYPPEPSRKISFFISHDGINTTPFPCPCGCRLFFFIRRRRFFSSLVRFVVATIHCRQRMRFFHIAKSLCSIGLFFSLFSLPCFILVFAF